MDVISAARQLGEALQADPAYVRFAKAMIDSEKDTDLQDKIGKFNIARMNLDNELSKDDKDEVKVKTMNEELRALYNDIMAIDENDGSELVEETKRESDIQCPENAFALPKTPNTDIPYG